MTTSPFAPYANAVIRFSVAFGNLQADRLGNLKPGQVVLEVEALLEQKRDPNRDHNPGVDPSSIWLEGYLITPRPLPQVVTLDSPASIVWQNRQGRFFIEFTARNPYLAALNIDLVERIRGWFLPGSFAIEGEPWEPTPPLNTTYREVLTPTTTGQTAFTLLQAPQVPADVALFVNGVKAVYGMHYTVAARALTWTATDMNLDTTDRLEVLYD